MSEETRVLSMFRKGIKLKVKYINGAKDQEEAKLWLGELLHERESWERVVSAPSHVLTAGTWASGFTVTDTSETKVLAQRRIEIIDEALKEVEGIFKDKGWSVE